jgi:fatty-acyl-CoA synthase
MPVGDLIRHNAEDPGRLRRPFLRFGDWQCSFGDYYAESVRWANLILELRIADRPLHVGVLLDNTPDYLFALGGAALAGAVAVGINNTKRGAHLARDIAYTDCAMLITEPRYLPLLSPAWGDCGIAADRLVVTRRWERFDPPAVDRPLGPAEPDGQRDAATLLAQVDGRADPHIAVSDRDTALLVFTSGTVTAPKAVMVSHGRLLETGKNIGLRVYELRDGDAGYIAMPLFHANALMCGWMPALVYGVPLGLIRRFSATRWLGDIRRYGATFFNYTGKPLAYLLATEPRPDDADNPLRICFGNEGSAKVVQAFETRFGCRVIDVFGSSEGGVGVTRQPDDPPGSIGFPAFGIAVVDEEGNEKPPARFDASGRLLNAEQCVGEIVNTQGLGWFEGYYRNEEAMQRRTRKGWYWTGDLGYKDERGYLYFAGRDIEWIRVDGENFVARPIEEILHRHPDIVLAAVYGAPDPDGGDRVMAALILRPGALFDPEGFAQFLAAQADLSPKWAPAFVRIARELPQTATAKILKTQLRHEKYRPDRCRDPVYWRPPRQTAFRPFTAADYEALYRQFVKAGKERALDL